MYSKLKLQTEQRVNIIMKDYHNLPCSEYVQLWGLKKKTQEHMRTDNKDAEKKTSKSLEHIHKGGMGHKAIPLWLAFNVCLLAEKQPLDSGTTTNSWENEKLLKRNNSIIEAERSSENSSTKGKKATGCKQPVLNVMVHPGGRRIANKFSNNRIYGNGMWAHQHTGTRHSTTRRVDRGNLCPSEIQLSKL